MTERFHTSNFQHEEFLIKISCVWLLLEKWRRNFCCPSSPSRHRICVEFHEARGGRKVSFSSQRRSLTHIKSSWFAAASPSTPRGSLSLLWAGVVELPWGGWRRSIPEYRSCAQQRRHCSRAHRPICEICVKLCVRASVRARNRPRYIKLKHWPLSSVIPFVFDFAASALPSCEEIFVFDAIVRRALNAVW